MDGDKRKIFDETRAALELKLAEFEKNAKKIGRKAKYVTKYIYVKGGHEKNEALGFLTVFNFNRALNVKCKRFIEYDPSNKRLYLDIYQLRKRDIKKKLPVFVYIHGGGWIGGSPETREAFTTRIAAEGYFVVSLFYGNAPTYSHPRLIQNIFKAFKWIYDNAAQYNIDAENLIVGGESAGAHLAAMAGAIATNPDYAEHFELPEERKAQRIRGLVLNCGVYDLEKADEIPFRNIKFYVESYLGGRTLDELDEKTREEISPIRFVNADFPPTIAISAENDKLATQTFDLVARLDELNVEVTHFHGTGRLAVHAFAVAQVLKVSKLAMAEVKEFMLKVTERFSRS